MAFRRRAVGRLSGFVPVCRAGRRPGRADRRQRVAREREVRQQRFSARIDSLVSSGEFQFLPVSMMWSPRMQSQIIDGYYYYVGIFKEQLQVHMPVVVGRR